MEEQIVSTLNRIDFVNRLYTFKRCCLGDYIIEVSELRSMQDALIIKNILLLLNQAGKLRNIFEPVSIGNWFKIYHKDYDEMHREKNEDDALDALAYALNFTDKQYNKAKKDLKKKENQKNKRISIEDMNIVLNKSDMKDTIDSFAKYTMMQNVPNNKEETLPGGIPISFKENKFLPDKELAEKYNRGVATIRRWRRLLKNESSK